MDLKKWAFSILFIAAGLFAAYLALWTGWIAAMLGLWVLFPPQGFGVVLLVLYVVMICGICVFFSYQLFKRAVQDIRGLLKKGGT